MLRRNVRRVLGATHCARHPFHTGRHMTAFSRTLAALVLVALPLTAQAQIAT
jgi:hypothetical protein